MQLSRRKVFSGAIAVAASSALPGRALALASRDRDRLTGLLASGATLDGQNFGFHDGKPLVIATDQAFKLRNCRFTWYGKQPAHFLSFAGKRNRGRMTDCTFEHAGLVGIAKRQIVRSI